MESERSEQSLRSEHPEPVVPYRLSESCESFVREVRQRTGLGSNAAALDASRAVLDTLLACLPGALASEVSAHLPCSLRSGAESGLRDSFRDGVYTPGERLSLGEFLERVARREGRGGSTGTEDTEDTADVSAFCHAQAVLQMLGASLGYTLVERVRAELPLEFDALWGVDPLKAHMHQPVQTESE